VSDLLSKSELGRVILLLFIYVLSLEIQLSEKEGGNPINLFKHATCFVCPKLGSGVPKAVCRDLFSVHWFEIRCGCWFC